MATKTFGCWRTSWGIPDFNSFSNGANWPRAAKLLRQHGTLEQALQAGELAAQADDLRLYRRIATMDSAAPLPPLPDQTPTWTTAADLARAWELNRLAERLAALAQSAQ
jgi:hypothetical protein